MLSNADSSVTAGAPYSVGYAAVNLGVRPEVAASGILEQSLLPAQSPNARTAVC